MIRARFVAGRSVQYATAALARQTAVRTGTTARQYASRSRPILAAFAQTWAARSARTFPSHGASKPASGWASASSWLFRTARQGFRSSARFQSSQAGGQAAPEAQSLKAKFKKLSREYGWSAVGVYLALSVLDFPFCFLLVRTVGTDRIGEIEHWVVSNAARIIPQRVQDLWHDYRAALKQSETAQLGNDDISETVEMAGWGVKEAEEHNRAEASLATQLALAYAIHKSFIFVRVPLTAAVTPKVVKVLRSYGFRIGPRRRRAA